MSLFSRLRHPATDFKTLLAKGALIVDVRTETEFTEGHIPGALNIPLDRLQVNVAGLKAEGRPLITCCRSGNRSAVAQAILDAAGCQAYNGGAWTVLKLQVC